MARCPRAEIGVIFVESSSLGAETLLERLCRQPAPHPVVVLTDTSDFDCVVRAFRLGAMDVLPRDVADEGLGDCLRQALAQDRARLTARRKWSEVQGLLDSLTPRERQVMDRVVAGYANREIAVELEISEKTVEVHRHKVMLKMEADSLAELVRKNVVLESAAVAAPRLDS
jgi:FixJ family two-component response regulator